MKYLISIFFIFFSYSCKEIQNKNISTKVNHGIKKIENIIEKKNIKNKNIEYKSTKTTESLFYYLGEPYFIQGVKYTPVENYNYSEIGISTYYGKELHNVKTVNNDLNKVTELLARHKTLPIPSMVKVTNLENGLSINVKIVDRHEDNSALIDVSRKSAQLLGFYKNKIATVKVEILSDASKQWKNVSLSLSNPEFNETISSAPTDIVSITDIDNENIILNENNVTTTDPIEIASEEIEDFTLYLKIYGFENYSDLQENIDSIGINLKFTSEKNGPKYNLIIGPLLNTEIKNLVSHFISKGYKETEILLK